MSLKNTLKKVKLNESTISMLLGAVVIIVIGAFAINYFSSDDEGETIPALETQQEETSSEKHVVQEGEDLWKISEKYFGTGYNWVDIAEFNNISDPNQISEGDEIKIPEITQGQLADNSQEQTPTPSPAEDTEVSQGEPTAQPTEQSEVTSTPTATLTPTSETGEEVDSADDSAIPEAGSEYTVQQGDSLWKIADEVYGDPYRWVDIAKANDLANPDVIHAGNVFTLP